MKRFQQLLVDAGYDIGSSPGYPTGVDGAPGKLTKIAALKYAKAKTKELGLKWFDKNLIEIRMSGVFTDKFSDICLPISGGKVMHVLPWTTKPGKYWINNPVTVGGITGTGIVQAGQVIDSHQFVSGSNKWGKRGFFKQIKSIFIHRDGNKDNILDKNIVQVAPKWYGFFIHPMGRGFSIWNWSAGCRGNARRLWAAFIAPYFNDGDVISPIIIEA